jgi:tyrosine-protein kinase Etk/Wzc
MNSDSRFPLLKDEDNIDITRYFSLLLSNWYWFAISWFLALSIAYSINRWSEDVFTISASLLIKDDQLGGVDAGMTNIFPGIEGFKSQQNLKNEIGILKSYDLNYKVMSELKSFHVEYIAVGKRGFVESRIYNGSPFIVVYDSLKDQTMSGLIEVKILSEREYELKINGDDDYSERMAFGQIFCKMGFNFRIELRDKDKFVYDPNESNKYLFSFISPEVLANQYRGKLSVSPIEEDATLVVIATTGFEPMQEADYLNKLMDVYLEFGLSNKNEAAELTMGFIEEQLNIISDSLRIAEEKLVKFRLENKLIDISFEGAGIQRRMERLDSERANLVLKMKYYEYLSLYLESKSEDTDIISPSALEITDPLLIKLVSDLTLLQKQKEELALNLGESVLPLKILEANILTTRNSIKESVDDGLANIQKSISDADLYLLELEDEVNRLPSTERQMINFQRKFDINNTVYTFLLEKRAEAGIAKASNVSDNRIIDRANSFSTARIKPKERQNITMAFVLGFFIPVLFILMLDFLNNKIIDKRDIEKGTRAPIIGFISHNNLKTEIPVEEKPGSTLTESFRSVRTNLKYFLKDIQNPVISISSTITAEGKTFISANLAAVMASLGKKVLLIGLDLRKPRTHKIFKIDNSVGISNYLIGESKYEDILIKTVVDNLWYAPSGPVPPNPAELIESVAMKEFIEQAKKEFDYIVIDTPPVAIVTDALLVSPLTDFYIFVVRQRYTSKDTLGLIEELHRNDNIKSLGILMNDVSMAGYYGYGLRYGYTMGYGYSYGHNYYGGNYYGRYGYSEKSNGYYTET